MRNREFVRSIYPGAWCERFRPIGHKFIVRYYPSYLSRVEPIGWGETAKKAWKDAVDGINIEIMEKLES